MAAGCNPRINDISTDRVQPPHFLVAPPKRLDYHTARLAAPTDLHYPDLRNLTLPQPPAAVFAAVTALVARRGWRVAAREDAAGDQPARLQAVATTLLLRFRDDVLIEVRAASAMAPAPGATPGSANGSSGGAIVAMRSKSRIGRGDLGTNARRIRAFLADLRATLDAGGGSGASGAGVPR